MNKTHIPNVGVEPSIFNWSSVSPLQRKAAKDRSYSSRHTCTSTISAGETAVMPCTETDEELESTCPFGKVEVDYKYNFLAINLPPLVLQHQNLESDSV